MTAPAGNSDRNLRQLLAISALPLLWFAMALWGGGPLDREIYKALYAGHHPDLIALARLFTFLGEPTVLIGAGFLVAGFLWWRERPRLALALLLVFLVGRGLSEVQKYWIARPRPAIDPHLVVVKTPSFPSGHATSSMIFYLTIALALTSPRWRPVAVIAAICLSLCIGVSRVMLGVHWPSDVVGGWTFGMFWALSTTQLSQRLLKA